MPLYDFACRQCGANFEDMARSEEHRRPCPVCGHGADRLVSVGRAWRADAPWLESVAAVAEKGSGKPHVDAFLAAPGRDTYRNWLRGEGLRPLEPGEGRHPPPDRERFHREIFERHQARRGLS